MTMQGMYETYQHAVLDLCVAALAALFLGTLAYAVRDRLSALVGFMRAHPWASLVLSPAVAVLVVYGSTKPTPTPTVKGITLGSPMETPSHVSLEWQADEGKEITTNQLVRVYWRDAYSGGWHLAAEGYGITNATVSGFFINRDTDWMVEVEDPDEQEDDE